jgi:hypothetical protein
MSPTKFWTFWKRLRKVSKMATLEEILAEKERRRAGQSPQSNRWQRFKANWLPDDDDTTLNTGETVAAAINNAGEAMTFGLIGDEADARVKSWLPGGGTYQEELANNRRQEEMLEQQSPGLALGSEVGGALVGAAIPMGALSRAGALASRIPSMARYPVATGLVDSALAGAGMAGTYGFMEGEGLDDRLEDMQSGAVLGAGAGVGARLLGSAVQKVADRVAANRGLRQAARGAPTSDQLRAAGARQYDQIDNAGVQVAPQAFSQFRRDLVGRLSDEGLDVLPGPGSLTPKAARVLQIAEEMDGQVQNAAAQGLNPGIPFKSIDQLRRHAGTAAANMAPDAATDRRLGTLTIEALDDFVQNAPDTAFLAGDLQALRTALPKARDLWRRMSKSQLVDDAIENAGTYLSGPTSGLRNQIGSLLRNKRLRRGFTAAEREALERVSQGTALERMVINLGGGLNSVVGTAVGPAIGAGVGSAMGAGGAAAGAALGGLVGMGVNQGAARLAENIVSRNAEIARALIARGNVTNLPTASPRVRSIVESMVRRGAAPLVQ